MGYYYKDRVAGGHGLWCSIISVLFGPLISLPGISNHYGFCVNCNGTDKNNGFPVTPRTKISFVCVHQLHTTKLVLLVQPLSQQTSSLTSYCPTAFKSAFILHITHHQNVGHLYFKRNKRPCVYYSNSSATFQCMLKGDLVFKLNPGPESHGKQSSIVPGNNNKIKAPRHQAPLAFSPLNVCSLRSSLADFLECVFLLKADLIAVTETWLTPDDVAVRRKVTPSDYKIIVFPRIDRRGSSLALLHKTSLVINGVVNKKNRHLNALKLLPDLVSSL